VTFLIDGYNLMHAVGLATKALPAKAFDRARVRLLDWLADAVEGRAETVRVVFDSQRVSAPSTETAHRGVRVLFAHSQTADDRIAELVAAERRPEMVTVVSNDHPVREDARRRGCRVLACSEFVDWVIGTASRERERPEALEKPEPAATPAELAAWLEAFSTPKKRAEG
jgi:predicted RNA-binding protein with PIN domain